MGISRLVAYEIVANPDDIVIDAGGPESTGKFFGWVTRGPGHNYKLLLSTQPVYDTSKQAKQAMEELVAKIKEFVKKDLEDPNNPLKDFFYKPSL